MDTVNADPRSFRWTKSADDILDTIKRFCLRTLDTPQPSDGNHQNFRIGTLLASIRISYRTLKDVYPISTLKLSRSCKTTHHVTVCRR